MNTNELLAKGVEMLLERTQADDAKLAELQASNDQQAAEIASLKAAAADAGAATAWDEKAKGLLDKIEKLVGPISDDGSDTVSGGGASTVSGGASGQPVVGSDGTTVTGSDGTTTTFDHATGSSSTVDASGTPVATDTAAADQAKAAAVAAGAVPAA